MLILNEEHLKSTTSIYTLGTTKITIAKSKLTTMNKTNRLEINEIENK